jgi:signal peptidase II
MRALTMALLAVPLIDLALKLLLRRTLGSRTVLLGPFGSLRVVAARIWLVRLGGRASPTMLWTIWTLTTGALVIASTWLPSSGLFIGLLLGGALSNALESSIRGSVSDYVCLRFWPAFNLADVALTAGGIGLVANLLIAMKATSS